MNDMKNWTPAQKRAHRKAVYIGILGGVAFLAAVTVGGSKWAQLHPEWKPTEAIVSILGLMTAVTGPASAWDRARAAERKNDRDEK